MTRQIIYGALPASSLFSKIMKVKGHIMVMKGYGTAIMASQWRDELAQRCEERNQEHYAPGDDDEPEHDSTYLAHYRSCAVVTVEFDVPDDVFKRQPLPEVQGVVLLNGEVSEAADKKH